MKRIGSRLLVFATTLLCLGVSWAGFSRAVGPKLFVNELIVLRLHGRYQGAGPEERVASAARALSRIGPTAHVVARGPKIYGNGRLLLTVTRNDSAPYGMKPASLATVWAHKIQQASEAPPLKFEMSQLDLPGGTSRTVALIGSKSATASVESSDEQVIKVRRVDGGVTLSAFKAGTATVTAAVPGAVQSIVVVVKPYAATLPQAIEARVSGAPATAETVRGAIENAVHNSLKMALGTDVKLLSVAPADVPSGQSKTFIARVRAFGPESITSEGQVYVTAKNIALPQKEEAELWYCNDPENVKGPGALFSASLFPDSPARLLYHHQNSSHKQLVLKVQAVNNSDVPAKLMLIPGDSSPDADPMRAGIRAADQFVRNWRCGSGEIVTIPPHNTLPISIRRLYPGQTVSGLCTLRLLSGDGPESLLVRADARDTFTADARWKAAIKSPTPWREVGPQHIRDFDPPARTLTEQIYPNPYQFVEAVYEVGGRFGFIRIGQKAIPRKDRQGGLAGNFGVVYKIRANLSNPTSQPADIELVFESSAGYAGALFILNGDLVKTPILKPKTEFRLLRVHLAPQATREVSLTTVPLSGASYPATLAIRPVGSLARFGPSQKPPSTK